MTGRATFGDSLHAAHQSLAAGTPPPAAGDVEEVTRSLLRLVTILDRYVQDTATAFTGMPRHMPLPSAAWDRASVQALEALSTSAGLLTRHGPAKLVWPAAPSAGALARRLDEAARSLACGRDLLHTHFTPGPHGGRAHQSQWAPVITSPPVNRALLAEIGSLAQAIAHRGANVALTPVSSAPADVGLRRRLNAACQWLWTFGISIDTARRAEPVPAEDRHLLAAIPVNTLPSRPALTVGGATVADLCDGVIATAERTRHLAWQAIHVPFDTEREDPVIQQNISRDAVAESGYLLFL